LAADLRALGVAAGMTLITHSSLSRIGWVANGAEAVIWALMDVMGPTGTLVMPSFSGHHSDPADWTHPPVPKAWHNAIRDQMQPFDPARTQTRNMGQIPELFRTWPGVHRSNHPVMSLAFWGKDAETLASHHPIPWALGDESPMGQIYQRDGKVLLIGVGYDRNSSLHLAETRAHNRRTRVRRLPVAVDGQVVWGDYPDVAADYGLLFPRIGADFDIAGPVVTGVVGAAESRLMPQRALVDFASAWLDRTS
jgi:aminoglycoside 3-N-acetyltransferase